MSVNIEMCQCNRLKAKPHCPKCGSQWVASVHRNGREKVEPNGSKVWVNGFRCRLCGQQFQEDWPCAAPPKPIGSALRRKSEVEKGVEKINPRDREVKLKAAREAVQKLLQARGMVPNEAPSSPDVDSRSEGEYHDKFFGGE